jgi:hypothetical protein
MLSSRRLLQWCLLLPRVLARTENMHKTKHLEDLRQHGIKTEFKDWIYLTQESPKWRALLYMIINLRVKLLTTWVTISFSKSLWRIAYIVYETSTFLREQTYHLKELRNANVYTVDLKGNSLESSIVECKRLLWTYTYLICDLNSWTG